MQVQCSFFMNGKVVEVFKTNVTDAKKSYWVIRRLLNFMPGCRINFDLEDEDNILRVEGYGVIPAHVVAVLEDCGFTCEVLL